MIMNDFSFYNKAYDLIQNLKEDGIIREHKARNITNIRELRLILDITKIAYPLYSNADIETLSNFINDIYNVKTLPIDITNASSDPEIWRTPYPDEIKPGVKVKIEGISRDYQNNKILFYYYYTFPKAELSLKRYSDIYMFIWNNAVKNKAWIINTFKYRIGDKVAHKDDPNSIGIIKSRIPATNYFKIINPYERIENSYAIDWYNKGNNENISLYYWMAESSLIYKTNKLEALPMKTYNNKKESLRTKVKVRYEEYNPKEWVNEKVAEGYDRKVHEKVLEMDSERNIDRSLKAGWIQKERTIIVNQNSNLEKRINFYFGNKNKYKNVEIIDSEDSIHKKPSQHKKYKPRHQLPVTPRPEKYIERLPINSEEYWYKAKKEGQEIVVTSPLVCVKHVSTGVISRIRKNEAKKLIGKKDNYDYCSKLEWRQYLNELKKKKDKLKPGLTTIGKDPVTGSELNRKARRFDKQKYHKGSRLVKEQFVPKIVPEEKVTIKSMEPTLDFYDDNGNYTHTGHFESTYIKKAHVVLKRILTRIKPRFVKLTETLKEQIKERSIIDKIKYLKKKELKSLEDLKEEFKYEERRNDHYSDNEKWSKSFKILVTLILTGKLYDRDVHVATISKNHLFDSVKRIINEDNHNKWDDTKINDFIRYIRLTSHGIFTTTKQKVLRPEGAKKLAKIKKPRQQSIFEPVKFITKIDYRKLKYNSPDENKALNIKFGDPENLLEKRAIFKEGIMYGDEGEELCKLSNVFEWKYEKDDEFKSLLEQEEGAITKIPIKFKKIIPKIFKK